ncbi:MAG TPA: UDP-N-acetylmuramoyl-L-alanyl-D-glutamate--2,6-diaminopimelate ligase [Gaiellaceae bacterium]|nr:UDP-N-acetylmuramoyl-L-alanyl-D-glutamate--2,6-diaminopimelate ligase [Gaiellaceae bacterium]
MGTTLAILEALIPGAVRRGDATIGDVSDDSRAAGAGMAFCALGGRNADGHEYAAAAVAAHTPALIVERFLDLPVSQLRVPNVRRALGTIAAAVHEWPSERLRLIAITGTDGKTTTAHFVEQCLAAQNRRTGSIGTVAAGAAGRKLPSHATTPEAPELHRLLAAMAADGVEDVVMEVSSHGLDLGRVSGLSFDVAVFTNLSPEHLDHHKTMSRYWDAKSRLFDQAQSRFAVIGVDDEWGARLSSIVDIPHITFGRTPHADAVIEAITTDLTGTTALVRWRGEQFRLTTVVPGEVNALNATAAFLAANALGVPSEQAIRALASAPGVPGRFERVAEGQPFLVVVDYAHTAASLTALVRTARSVVSRTNRVIVVLGARGGRYRDKRAALGRAAAVSDLVIITTDSPGGEDPAAIAGDILRGCSTTTGGKTTVELDRGAAIRLAISLARPGDAVLIVGRGHEQYYEVGNTRIALDDRETARAVLKALWPPARAESEVPATVLPFRLREARAAVDVVWTAARSGAGSRERPDE